jgi:hypothetical protein
MARKGSVFSIDNFFQYFQSLVGWVWDHGTYGGSILFRMFTCLLPPLGGSTLREEPAFFSPPLVLGFELRASQLLNRLCTTEATPSAPFEDFLNSKVQEDMWWVLRTPVTGSHSFCWLKEGAGRRNTEKVQLRRKSGGGDSPLLVCIGVDPWVGLLWALLQGFWHLLSSDQPGKLGASEGPKQLTANQT